MICTSMQDLRSISWVAGEQGGQGKMRGAHAGGSFCRGPLRHGCGLCSCILARSYRPQLHSGPQLWTCGCLPCPPLLMACLDPQANSTDSAHPLPSLPAVFSAFHGSVGFMVLGIGFMFVHMT